MTPAVLDSIRAATYGCAEPRRTAQNRANRDARSRPVKKLCWALALGMGLGLGVLAPAATADPWDDDELDVAFEHRPPVSVVEPSKKQERFNRFMAIGVSGAAMAGILFGLTKMYFAWKGWQKAQSRPRAPWEK
jgi:hypothetical protein